MVSTNSSPPIAMPVQVPPGHVVQQIVDESGTLRHVILSPQHPAGLVPLTSHNPQHYVSCSPLIKQKKNIFRTSSLSLNQNSVFFNEFTFSKGLFTRLRLPQEASGYISSASYVLSTVLQSLDFIQYNNTVSVRPLIMACRLWIITLIFNTNTNDKLNNVNNKRNLCQTIFWFMFQIFRKFGNWKKSFTIVCTLMEKRILRIMWQSSN